MNRLRKFLFVHLVPDTTNGGTISVSDFVKPDNGTCNSNTGYLEFNSAKLIYPSELSSRSRGTVDKKWKYKLPNSI